MVPAKAAHALPIRDTFRRLGSHWARTTRLKTEPFELPLVTLALPPEAQGTPCVHIGLRSMLDPCLSGYSPQAWGHMPPTDFCNGVSPEHTQN
jgi:hypothetical protein